MKLFYKNIKKAENNQLLHYKCNKKSLNRGGSYIDSPKRLKNKKVTIDRKKMTTNAFNMLLQLR